MSAGGSTLSRVTDLVYRRAAPDDARALAGLAAATFPLACPPSSVPQDQAAFIGAHLSVGAFERYLADPARDLLVADAGADGLVGYTMLALGEPSDPDVAAVVTTRPTAELSKCYLLGNQHGTGVGRRLMELTLEVARGRSLPGVWLGVNAENARARAFYRRHGFEVVGERTFEVGAAREHDLVLARSLADISVSSMLAVPGIRRDEPPSGLAEGPNLAAWLDYHRGTFEMKCHGLDDAQLAERALPPSTLSLLGLLRHLTEVERSWFQRGLAGEEVAPLYYSEADPDGDFDSLDSHPVAEVWAAWREATARSREIATTEQDLERTYLRRGEPVSVRWVLSHMLEEYARHNGHADLLRERIDGQRGE